jgi:hypothetical protein
MAKKTLGIEEFLPTQKGKLVPVQAMVDEEILKVVRKKLKANDLKLTDLIRATLVWYINDATATAHRTRLRRYSKR